MIVWLITCLFFLAIYKLALGVLGYPDNLPFRLFFWRGKISKAIGPVEALGKKFPSSFKSYLIKQLTLAGSPRNITVEGLISLMILSSFSSFWLIVLAAVVIGLSIIKLVSLLAVVTTISFFLPIFWLKKLISIRQKAIRLALPDTLDLLTVSIEAGLGFDAALSKVAKNTASVLADEFYRLLQEIQLGASRKEAFKGLLERTNVPELNSFILALLQADVFGISIGKVLRVEAKEMRIKRRQRAEEMAMKTPVKIVFPLVLCIFPALNVVILGPAAIQIYQNLFGR